MSIEINPEFSKNVTIKCLGFEVTFTVPSTIEENDRLAKVSGFTLDSAISNVLYRSILPGVRADICEGVEELTKIARKTKVVGKTKPTEASPEGEDKVVWDETEGDYLDRVLASGVNRADLLAIVQKAISNNPYDPSVSEKKDSGPKKIAKKYLEAAQKVIDMGKADVVASKLAAELNITVLPDLNSLGKAIAEREKRRAEAELAQLTS